jgi:ferredoxin
LDNLPVTGILRGYGTLQARLRRDDEAVAAGQAQLLARQLCLCRQGENCRTYPRDIGCIFLGDGATGINPRLGRAADVEEAMAHMRRAMEAGLTPLVVHAAFDAWLVGIPYHRMLAVCFCCDCCCTIRHGLRLGPPAFWDTVVRLPGLAVEVGDGCTGCGSCLDVCPVRAIALKDGCARVGEQCKGCGRCVAACPSGAITLRVDEDTDVLGNLLARIERRTAIW